MRKIQLGCYVRDDCGRKMPSGRKNCDSSFSAASPLIIILRSLILTCVEKDWSFEAFSFLRCYYVRFLFLWAAVSNEKRKYQADAKNLNVPIRRKRIFWPKWRIQIAEFRVDLIIFFNFYWFLVVFKWDHEKNN